MDKELPDPNNGRTAFTVFGFGGDRYADFDSPMENSANIESFNATNSIAFPSRPTHKNRKSNGPSSSEGSTNVCKLRVGGPDSSRLVLQSLLPSSAGVASQGSDLSTTAAGGMGGGPLVKDTLILAGHQQLGRSAQRGQEAETTPAAARKPSSYQPAQRRYSASHIGSDNTNTAVGETTRETHTDQLLQMFTSNLISNTAGQGGNLYTPGQTGDLASLAQMAAEGGTTKDYFSPNLDRVSGSSSRPLTRQGSSPVLSSLANQAAQQDVGSTPSGGRSRGFLTRRASSGAISTLASLQHDQQQGSAALACTEPASVVATQQQSSTDARSGALQTSSGKSGAGGSASSSVDAPDAGSSSGPQRGIGYGVLARTRQFGAWLGQITEGEKIEVTKKDLNVFAPTSF